MTTQLDRAVSHTDDRQFYFIAGEHQADIWVAEVEEK
jgi:hypothetical protein